MKPPSTIAAKPNVSKREAAAKIGVTLPKVICSREISSEEALAFFTEGKTAELTEFISRFGRPFAATLVLKDNGRHGFDSNPAKAKRLAPAPRTSPRRARPRPPRPPPRRPPPKRQQPPKRLAPPKTAATKTKAKAGAEKKHPPQPRKSLPRRPPPPLPRLQPEKTATTAVKKAAPAKAKELVAVGASAAARPRQAQGPGPQGRAQRVGLFFRIISANPCRLRNTYTGSEFNNMSTITHQAGLKRFLELGQQFSASGTVGASTLLCFFQAGQSGPHSPHGQLRPCRQQRRR